MHVALAMPKLRTLVACRLGPFLQAWVEAEQGRFALWLPVCMGAGVLFYFAQSREPPPWAGAAVLGLAAAGALLTGAVRMVRGFMLCIAAFGLGLASVQFAAARAPPLEPLPQRATILTGVVRAVEALPDGRRIAVEQAQTDGGPVRARWVRVRLRPADTGDIGTGDTIRVRALLRPPAPPAYPGAWDLQRDAYFSGQGGGGYALAPVERIAAGPPQGLRLIQRLREIIANRLSAGIPGPAGTIAVTLLTGGQTSIPPNDHDAFRASGLAHLLAVAGLHIGIVMGWVLAATRCGFALSEYASLRWPTKQLAALLALLAGGFYMLLTGMHVPIVRSFAMASLYTVAIIAGRRAVSMRGLAVAAVVLMLIEPQEVPGVSFQMSFSAVLALIAGYEVLRPALHALRGPGTRWRCFALYVAALALTSALAGTASAPYGAYHFGRIQIYFVLANMIAVPITALWVMPAGMVALALMPFGVEQLALTPMGWGIEAILWVARTMAALPAATLPAPYLPAWGLAAIALGTAWLGLWRSKLRLAGVAILALGLLAPLTARPPDILVSADARLIAVRSEEGVFVQQNAGASPFTRAAFLQLWGVDQMQPLPRDSGSVADGRIRCTSEACVLRPRPHARAALLVRDAIRPETCRGIRVIVSAEPARGLCPHPWPALVDRFTVWRDGATAVWLSDNRAMVVTDRAWRGQRPWVPPPPEPRPRLSPGLPLTPAETATED